MIPILRTRATGSRRSRPWRWAAEELCWGVFSWDAMALVPRWRFMSDEAKALTKRTAISAGVLLLVLLVFRGLLPWVVVALAAWWIWRAVSK